MEDEKMCINFDDNRSECCCCDGFDEKCHDYYSESTKARITITGHGKTTLSEALLKQLREQK